MQLGDVIKTFSSKKGSKVTIRCVKWEDLESLLKFANDISREDTFVMLSGEEVTKEDETEYLQKSIDGIKQGKRIHLVAQLQGEIVGNCGVWRLKKRKGHVGVVDISISQSYRGEGIGQEMLSALIAEAKNEGYRMLMLYCFENNEIALKMYAKKGFQNVGILPQAYAYRGKYIGEVILYKPLV